MPEDLKLSQIGSCPLRLHSGDFTLPEYENTIKLSSPVISGNRLLRTGFRIIPVIIWPAYFSQTQECLSTQPASDQYPDQGSIVTQSWPSNQLSGCPGLQLWYGGSRPVEGSTNLPSWSLSSSPIQAGDLSAAQTEPISKHGA